MKSEPIIVGIGNINRNDDGVGIYIARRLNQQNRFGLKVVEHPKGATELIKEWQGFDLAIVCEAVHSGNMPGKIYRFDYPKEDIPNDMFNFSRHTFSLAQVLELANLIKQLPSKVIIYGIEGKYFTVGQKLSQEVKQSADKIVHQIENDVLSSLLELKKSA